MSNEAVNLAVVNNTSFEASRAYDLQHYDISSALQTTLEFHELLTIFSQKIQPFVPHSGFVYQNTEFDLDISQGIVSRHNCSYMLKIEDMNLGELKFMRSTRFKPQELINLEQLLCCLIYPLRNAGLLKQALNQAYTDPLTGTWNRSAFNDHLQRELRLAERNDWPFSLIFIDIDHFKNINDTYGHACGDQALKSVAKWIKQRIRRSDMLFRYGGEEFVILLSDTDVVGAEILAEKVRQKLDQHTLAHDMAALKLTASFGVAGWRNQESLSQLIDRADNAMYIAKKRGRNQVVVANE